VFFPVEDLKEEPEEEDPFAEQAGDKDEEEAAAGMLLEDGDSNGAAPELHPDELVGDPGLPASILEQLLRVSRR
jgi:hypothetical protein